MANAEVFAGICGFKTTIQAKSVDDLIRLEIHSDCQAITRLAAQLTEVDPFQEITYRRGGPLTLQASAKYCSHTACPVPVGIIKAVEVEAGLALPQDVNIKVRK